MCEDVISVISEVNLYQRQVWVMFWNITLPVVSQHHNTVSSVHHWIMQGVNYWLHKFITEHNHKIMELFCSVVAFHFRSNCKTSHLFTDLDFVNGLNSRVFISDLYVYSGAAGRHWFINVKSKLISAYMNCWMTFKYFKCFHVSKI